MRRAIAVAIVIGLGIWAVVSWSAGAGGKTTGSVRASAARAGALAAAANRLAVPRRAPGKPAATKVVVYLGLEFRVPASWPVYRLDRHPATCVRYDVHAVYLGTPGPDQQCPAHLVGRTQTISVLPAAGIGGRIAYQRAQVGPAGGSPAGPLPSVRAAIVQDTQRQVLWVTETETSPGATVIATYASSPATVEQVLSSLRPVSPASKALQRSAARRTADRAQASPSPTTSAWQGVPTSWPTQIVAPPPSPRPKRSHPVAGFDTCAAPSLATMKAWRPAFSATGIYIGGVNAACAPGNLSASWIRSAGAMGWAMLPLYVGPQAACWGGGGVLINAKNAAAEGVAAANDAISDAAFFGVRRGAPVYYDMEAYNENNQGCVTAVLKFIGGWSRQLRKRGYVPAVYSSQDSCIVDMQAAAVAKTPGFTPPSAIWIAWWDGKRTLADGNLVWPLSARSKQYLGPHFKTVGGVTLDIDSDLVGGPVIR